MNSSVTLVQGTDGAGRVRAPGLGCCCEEWIDDLVAEQEDRGRRA